jgi:hypothetical protein
MSFRWVAIAAVFVNLGIHLALAPDRAPRPGCWAPW